jgi:hypothetical protein
MTAPSPFDADALRVVFFGPKDSGKTQLLKACLQLAEPEQETISLEPVSLGAFRQYRVEYGEGEEREIFQVSDCDGRTADEFLTTVKEGSLRRNREQLAGAIRQADALVIAVDASLNSEQLKSLFKEFLLALEDARCYGREVGGLPVLLTLTKCDFLLRATDQPTDWLNRVDEKTEQIQQAFQDLVGEVSTGEDWHDYLPFGTLDVSVHATALRMAHPQQLPNYLDANGDFGVKKLWDDLTSTARSYRDRQDSGRKRLRWTLSATGGLVATLLGILLLLVAAGYGARDLLSERIKALRQGEPSVTIRFSDRNLNRNQKELQDIRENPLFSRLPADLQDFVTTRLLEYEAYREYRTRFLPPRLGPAEVQSRAQVQQLQTDLETVLQPPPEYAQAWAETDAARLRQKWQTDVVLVSEAESLLHEWFRALIRRGNQLMLTERAPDFSWRGQVTALLTEAGNPPHKPSDELAKSLNVPVLRGRKLKFESAYRFDRVQAAERDWHDTREKLIHLRDLCDATGLTSGPGTPAAVLDIPEPTVDGASSKELATARLAGLRLHFPGEAYPDNSYPEWGIQHFPDAVRRALLVRISNIRDTGLRHVRRLILQQLGTESAEAWRAVANGLLQEESLRSWGQLLRLLNLWLDPKAKEDPVQEAVRFLRQSKWPVNVKVLSVTIPDDLLEPRATPTGKLLVKHGNKAKEYNFQVVGDPKRERPLSVYNFVAVGSAMQFDYLPGEELVAELKLRSGSDEYTLIWSASRSKLFQLDALQQPARLEKVGPIPATRLVNDVRMVPIPSDGWPTVPQLLPERR